MADFRTRWRTWRKNQAERWRGWIANLANWLRRKFDYFASEWDSVLLISVLAVVAGALGLWVRTYASSPCGQLPFSLIDFETTFSAKTFRAMLRSSGTCKSHLLGSLGVDIAFASVYPLLLSALYIWAERYRRSSPGETNRDTLAAKLKRPQPTLSSIFVLLPLVAAFLDVFAENLPLWLAAHADTGSAIDDPKLAMVLLVGLGSTGAAVKWTLLAIFGLGLVGIFFRGPRGQVLWLLRFSVLAVLLGALPLLLLPQGQDILQLVAERTHPFSRLAGAVVALTAAALIVWYCARVLSLVRLSTQPRIANEWRGFFEIHIPRILGVAVLVLGGAAFAHAGLAFLQFFVVVAVSYVGFSVLTHFYPGALKRVGAAILPGGLRKDPLLHEPTARAVISSALGIFIVWPAAVSWPLPESQWQYGGVMTHDRFALRCAAWGCIAAGWMVYLFVSRRFEIRALRAGTDPMTAHAAMQTQQEQGYPVDSVPRQVKVAAVLATIVSVIFFVLFTLVSIPVGRWLGPLVILALTASNAVFVGSWATYLGQKLRLPIVAALFALAFIVSRWNDNHDIRTVDSNAFQHAWTMHAIFDRWLQQRGEESPGEIPVILVGASGGGLRAAYWTAMALATLQDRDSAFARHVFAISSVSGGSLGAAVFTGTVRDLRNAPDTFDCGPRLLTGQTFASEAAQSATPIHSERTTTCTRLFMNDDFLSPVLSKTVAPDFVQWFLPVPIGLLDRSTALEGSWERSYADVMDRATLSVPYLSLYKWDDPKRDIPLLLLNTTHVQTGRRYVTAPVSDPGVFLDARNLHSVLQSSDMPLSVAVHNSARFAYVSPAGRIERRDGQSYGALVDGGYFENSGLASVADVLRELADTVKDRSTATDSTRALRQRGRFYVLYLCNDPQPCIQATRTETILSTKRSYGAEWLTPLLAVLSTRDARGSLAREEIKMDVGRERFFQLNVCESLAPPRAAVNGMIDSAALGRAKERVINPPLGWLLSHLARDWMDSSLTLGGVQATSPGDVWSRNCRLSNVATLNAISGLMPGPSVRSPLAPANAAVPVR